MIPWWRFQALARQLPRLEMADALNVATGVAYGYLDARTPKAQRFKLDFALKKARRYAAGTEADG